MMGRGEEMRWEGDILVIGVSDLLGNCFIAYFFSSIKF